MVMFTSDFGSVGPGSSFAMALFPLKLMLIVFFFKTKVKGNGCSVKQTFDDDDDNDDDDDDGGGDDDED